MKAIRTAALVGAIAIAASLVACSSAAPPWPIPPQVPSSEPYSTCFLQMDEQQKQTARAHMAEHPQSISDPDLNTICVLEDDGEGGFEEQYYSQEDGYLDYSLYTFVSSYSVVPPYQRTAYSGSAFNLLAYGLLARVMMDGRTYHPYTYQNGSWTDSHAYHSKKVGYVTYGKGARTSAPAAKAQPFPEKYKRYVPPVATPVAPAKPPAAPPQQQKPAPPKVNPPAPVKPPAPRAPAPRK